MEKKLYRSRKNRILAGVCGGIGEYFNTDPTLIRILAIIILLAFNIMTIIAYIIMAIIIPLEPIPHTTPNP